MRRILAIWTICALSSVSFCAAQVADKRPAIPFKPSQVNSARLRWMQYKMVTGRVVATSPYPEGMNISFGPSVLGGRLREQLQILLLKDQVSVHYELAGDGQQLSIALSENGDFSISRSARRARPMPWSIRNGPASRWCFRSSTKKRVASKAATVSGNYTSPRRNWCGMSWCRASSCCVPPGNWRPPAPRSKRRCFEPPRPPAFWTSAAGRGWSMNWELPAFRARERAQRELYRQGQAILPYLEALDHQALDAEQVARVDELINALAVEYEDTTSRIAAWLAGDPKIWLSLVDRPQAAKRRAAVRQLERLLGESIEFDPAADAATRQTQLDKLRERLKALPTSPAEVKR